VVKQLPVGVGHRAFSRDARIQRNRWPSMFQAAPTVTPVNLETPDDRYTRRRASSATSRPARVASSLLG
jgi:hypothetical protein